MSRVIRSTSRPYHRSQAMQWLADRCCWSGADLPDFADETPAGRAAVIDLLRRVCTVMRGAGIRGAWHYNLTLHAELVRILEAEEAQLAAIRCAQSGPTRSLPAITRSRRQRRAA